MREEFRTAYKSVKREGESRGKSEGDNEQTEPKLILAMKKIAILVIAFVPLATMAQKETKPSIVKAEKFLRDGKLDDAKSLIDLTVANREFMYDKKGRHSKNAANAWYIRGLIYASIDTTSAQQYKNLDPDPFKVEVASFDSCTAIDEGKGISY